jgi:hypothetical protein
MSGQLSDRSLSDDVEEKKNGCWLSTENRRKCAAKKLQLSKIWIILTSPKNISRELCD